jgi:hypothetical protein
MRFKWTKVDVFDGLADAEAKTTDFVRRVLMLGKMPSTVGHVA